jgi:hypothetical protein
VKKIFLNFAFLTKNEIYVSLGEFEPPKFNQIDFPGKKQILKLIASLFSIHK